MWEGSKHPWEAWGTSVPFSQASQGVEGLVSKTYTECRAPCTYVCVSVLIESSEEGSLFRQIAGQHHNHASAPHPVPALTLTERRQGSVGSPRGKFQALARREGRQGGKEGVM